VTSFERSFHVMAKQYPTLTDDLRVLQKTVAGLEQQNSGFCEQWMKTLLTEQTVALERHKAASGTDSESAATAKTAETTAAAAASMSAQLGSMSVADVVEDRGKRAKTNGGKATTMTDFLLSEWKTQSADY